MTTGREVTGLYLRLKAVAAICTAQADKPRSMSFPIIPQTLAASPKNLSLVATTAGPVAARGEPRVHGCFKLACARFGRQR